MSPRIVGFPIYHPRQVALFTSIAQLSCPYSDGAKGTSDRSHSAHHSMNLFSSKVPKSNSDYLKNYTTKQTESVAWLPALNNDVTARLRMSFQHGNNQRKKVFIEMQMNPLCLFFSSFEKENLLEDSICVVPLPPCLSLPRQRALIIRKYGRILEKKCLF